MKPFLAVFIQILGNVGAIMENAVCVLRNLSYRLYDEMPPSALQRRPEGRDGP